VLFVCFFVLDFLVFFSINENEVIEKAQKVADELIERSELKHMKEREWISLPKESNKGMLI
ncbi:MAG: hypothetical protein QW723_05265, partial [Candidatus Bathyarchaeia archaeon]